MISHIDEREIKRAYEKVRIKKVFDWDNSL